MELPLHTFHIDEWPSKDTEVTREAIEDWVESMVERMLQAREPNQKEKLLAELRELLDSFGIPAVLCRRFEAAMAREIEILEKLHREYVGALGTASSRLKTLCLEEESLSA